jgi:hypothetical protein
VVRKFEKKIKGGAAAMGVSIDTVKGQPPQCKYGYSIKNGKALLKKDRLTDLIIYLNNTNRK